MLLVSAFCTAVSKMDVFLRMTLLREREERQKAQEINKQLEERAKSLEMTAHEAAEGSIEHL